MSLTNAATNTDETDDFKLYKKLRDHSKKGHCQRKVARTELPPIALPVTMVYPPPGRLIYQGNSPTLSPG